MGRSTCKLRALLTLKTRPSLVSTVGHSSKRVTSTPPQSQPLLKASSTRRHSNRNRTVAASSLNSTTESGPSGRTGLLAPSWPRLLKNDSFAATGLLLLAFFEPENFPLGCHPRCEATAGVGASSSNGAGAALAPEGAVGDDPAAATRRLMHDKPCQCGASRCSIIFVCKRALASSVGVILNARDCARARRRPKPGSSST